MWRVMKNGCRIGRRWVLVEGHFKTGITDKTRWKTTFQIGDFHTKEAAEAALQEFQDRRRSAAGHIMARTEPDEDR